METRYIYGLFNIVTGEWVSVNDKPYIVTARSRTSAAKLLETVDKGTVNSKNNNFIYYDDKHGVMLDSYDDRHEGEPRGFVGIIEKIGRA